MIANRFQPLKSVRAGESIRARDVTTAQNVVLHPVADLDGRLVEVFHPGLLAIFAIVGHEGEQFAACESVSARTLAVVLAGARCQPRWAREIIGDVADAVAELHARGLSHGDISTSSILLTSKGKAKLSLTTAVTTVDPRGDIRALVTILEKISGRTDARIGDTDSAAVLAAQLRNLPEEPP